MIILHQQEEGEGGNARHEDFVKEWLNQAHLPYHSDHSVMLDLTDYMK